LRLRDLFLVGAGGSAGALSRYLLALLIDARLGNAFPYATLVINVTGSFILGVVGGAFEVESLPAEVRLGIGVGFLGAYTTFSTFTYETVSMLEGGRTLVALLYVGASLLVGFAAAAVGHGIGRTF
jgi:CrcB protein